ncbi:MMPL family transporter [Metabacillus malikii]|uniref:RND superfamily putative drug exporter n=1 Tax=Metabacillus malikii TaxID=1504265 RepID=A0ABT9ZHM2_9BACI|nr:MMPL family transporter [Metabacillus malikii]MDQ0231793.1 RND superfamily putative drug exporter [Metabacillus malikii]
MKMHPLEKWGAKVGGPRTRWVVLILWLVFAAGLAAIFPQVGDVENFAGEDLPEEMNSIVAQTIIDEEFSTDAGLPLLIVWYKESGLGIEDLQHIQQLYAKLDEAPLAEQKTIPPFQNMPTEALLGSLSENQKSFVSPVFFEADVDTEVLNENFEEIRAITEEIIGENPYDTESLDDDGLHARFSGPAGISVDATGLFESADFQLMTATVILILVILLLIYRSPLLAIIPLVVVSVAYLVVSPVLGAIADAGWIDKDAQSISIMIVLLFGAGTDYCLFLITKYRDLLFEEENKFLALARAVRESTGAIVMSGLTVVIGLATLALADYGAFQRFAVPFSLGVLITGFAVVTLLPAILALLGRKAFWPFVPRTPQLAREFAEKKNKPYKEPKANHKVMNAIGKFATGKPWLVIIVTAAILVSLAFVSRDIEYNYDLLSSFPEEMDSREGFTLIEENFTPGELAPVKVIVDTDGKDINIKEQLADLPYLDFVADPQTGENKSNYQLYEVYLNKNPYSNEAMADVTEMETDVAAILKDEDISAKSFWLGGETSKQIDTRDVQAGDEQLIQPVMIIIIFVVLLVYLRAVVTAVQLMATVIVSFYAALGLGWLVISGILGHESIASAIPLYSFVFIIALGNDYNIFMISDIWKNRKRGLSHVESISKGVASTGSVITSAGIILAGTFAVLASLPIQLLVQFGIVTAIGVLLDTFIVRPLLVPAIITVFGKWSYWPGKLWKKEERKAQESN